MLSQRRGLYQSYKNSPLRVDKVIALVIALLRNSVKFFNDGKT